MTEGVEPIQVRSVFRKLAIVFITLIVIFGSIHLFLYYKAASLLKAFVEQVSNGDYTASAAKVRFGYLPFRIRAINVKFHPLDSTGFTRTYNIRADTLQLRLTSLAPVLFYNSLEVSEVRLIRPEVLVTSDGSRAPREETRFNIPLKEIQEGLLKSLDLLQVDKCVIVDGGFKLMRSDIKKNFAVNHIDLTIDSLLAAKSGMVNAVGDTIGANILLNINLPDIEIPDSNYRVDVDKLHVDTKKNLFTIDELRFSRNKEAEAFDTIQLSSISLRGLNWNQLLNKGIIELDSVKVKNGLAQIDLTDRFIFQKRKDLKAGQRGTVDVPMILHYASVQQVSYKLRSRRKTGLFTILLDGDSLLVRNFTLLDTTARPLNLSSLSLNVRNYYDQDDNKTYLAGFDRLFIKDNNLDIKNYRIIPLKKKGFSANNRIEVPHVILYGYNLPELLRGRLEADRLEVIEPRIVLDILSNRNAKDSTSNKARPFFEALHRLQPTLDIGELGIKNARIVLQPRTNLADTIIISQLSTEINVEKLLSANNLDDLMKVTEGVKSDGFFITGARFEFKITNAEVSPVNNYLGMKRLQGRLESGLLMDLDNVQVIGKPGEMMIPVDGRLNLTRVSVGSGDVMVTAKPADSLPGQRKPAPALHIDSLYTGEMQLTYINKNGAATTAQRLALNVEGLDVDNSRVSWIDALIEGGQLQTGLGNSNISADSWHGNFPGSFSMEAVKVWPSARNLFGITTNLPKVEIKNRINSFNWQSDAIEELVLTRPQLRWTLAVSKDSTAPQKPFPPIFIPRVTINEPDLDGYRMTKTGEKRHTVVNGGFIQLTGVDLFNLNPDEVNISKLSLFFPKPVVEISDSWTIRPGSVRMLGNNIVWRKGELPRGIMDSAVVDGLGDIPVFKDDEHRFEVGVAGISNWYFPSPTDSFIFKLANGPDWWIGGANYTLKGKNGDMKVYNASARRANRTIAFDSLVMKPFLPRDSFWQSFSHERDYITLKLGSTVINNFRPATLDLKGAHLQSIMANDLELYAARDKRFPDDTVAYRFLLAKQLEKLPFDFAIDTFGIMNGKVTYHEISPKSGLQGELDIDRLYGGVYNIYTKPQKGGDSLVFDFRGNLFGQAPMHLYFVQPYLDSSQRFRFKVDLGKWDMVAANPLLAPLNSIEFIRGLSDSMWLEGWANDKYAYGWMGFYYRNLKLGILKNGYDREYFMAGPTNFLANLVMKNNNRGEATPFYVNRLRDKATFNYWGKMLSSAMMGSMGKPGKKREAKKAMRKENLPKERPEG